MSTTTDEVALPQSKNEVIIKSIKTFTDLLANANDFISPSSTTTHNTNDPSTASSLVSPGGDGDGDGDESNSRHDTSHEIEDQLMKWKADLNYIRSAINNLEALEVDVSKQLDGLPKQSEELRDLLQDPRKVKAVTRMIMKLKLDIPYSRRMNVDGTNVSTVRNVQDLFDVLLKLDAYRKDKDMRVLKNFEQNFERLLNKDEQRCLCCFSVFPEGAVVHKRLLVYWWVGEGWMRPQDGDYDKASDDILAKFVEMEYVQPYLNSKHKLVGFKMHALIRFAIIFLADIREYFSFDSSWNPTGDFSSCQRAILVINKDEKSRDIAMGLNPQKLITLFNISDGSLDFKPEWFLRMTDAKVLSLGKWVGNPSRENSAEKNSTADKNPTGEENPTTTRENDAEENSAGHIELKDTKFLKGLKNMKELKFLSLEGVSKVHRLPQEVLRLASLMILNLKACSNLEELPESIESLQNLTHLDVSECNLLCMPRGVESLSKLQVLKGFVINDELSSVIDLSKLTKLTKLSIIAIEPFVADVLKAIQQRTSLRKLTIVCAGALMRPRDLRRLNAQENNQLKRTSTVESRSRISLDPEFSFPEHLEKLDLQGFPVTVAPWLTPGKLKSLKKLYIRRGNLQYLNQAEDEGDKWNVKILRLQSMPELKMKWRELRRAFPELIYLKKVQCPKLNFFPCHENGIWMNSKMLSEQSLEGLGIRWSFLSSKLA